MADDYSNDDPQNMDWLSGVVSEEDFSTLGLGGPDYSEGGKTDDDAILEMGGGNDGVTTGVDYGNEGRRTTMAGVSEDSRTDLPFIDVTAASDPKTFLQSLMAQYKKDPSKAVEFFGKALGAWYQNDEKKKAAAEDRDYKKREQLEKEARMNASITALPSQQGIVQQAMTRTDGSRIFNNLGNFNRG